ncbi:hypothetical protein MKS88_005730 [Plasmodium brasilianum]|uniref:Uncharacterized protein n=2 Tax=Plasmodium (Plasmodium) TaxID=418103 RepID=A0A1A8WDX2_PLAMA|nr:conserved Plasmodium protein, unknown function [Plasmodium malariae]KAI4835047.1 hypothetical protein MKS88_005730 [Plasmodium brasilianum]SBS91110.1 conserved Plasmodium protein, unknown function [Plasmodium malariae]SCP03622.1 conserved Plasmodium protein, unknown function [Plasmodium malariae]
MKPLLNKYIQTLRYALNGRYTWRYVSFTLQRSNCNNIERKTCTSQVKPKENEDVLKVLRRNNFPLNINFNKIGTFTVFKGGGGEGGGENLLYDRIICQPSSYEQLEKFIHILEKEEIINSFDIYYYEDMLSNIKLNRAQNMREIFINVKEIMENKKIKNDEKKKFLEKKNINSLYYYNIQRYEHNVDPSSFLIDKKRLTKEEYTYQYISTALPYICFIFMLFFPHFLICFYIPYIKKKNEGQRKLCQILQFKQNIHSYKDIKPEQVINVIDNNVKTIIFFYNNNIFLNMYIKSLMVDLSKIFKSNYVPVNVVGIDTSKYGIHYNVLKDVNENLFPVLYFILPYHYNNDSAVLKIEKPLTLENILSQIKDFVHVPRTAFHQIKELNTLNSKLKKCIFEHEIMRKRKEDILYEYGSEVAHLSCLHYSDKVSF